MADRHPNRDLRALRETELHMSRPELAKALNEQAKRMGENIGCTARLIAAWEDGDVACPRAVYRRVLTAYTGRTLHQLGFALPESRPAGQGQTVDADEGDEGSGSVNRRSFLRDGVGVALALPAAGRSTGRIGVTEVRAVTAAVSTLYGHDHDHGSGPLRRAANEALHTAYSWLQAGTYTDRTGTRLRTATGNLSIAAGWLSYDSGRPADAHSLYGEALAAARIADDRALEAHAFGCLSLLAKAQGRPREAVANAQGAQAAARHLGSPRLLALFHAREAGGWALMGDRQATDAAIVRAHHHYAAGPHEADPAWLEFFTPAELAGLEALARADLGQHERAAAGAEQAVLLHGSAFARNRALYTADIAIHHAVGHRPEPEAAAEAAGRVLAFLPDVRSDRLLQALHHVAGALQRHARVPAVADWVEQYRTTTATQGGRT